MKTKPKNMKPLKNHKSKILDDFFSVTDKNEYEKTEKKMLLAIRIEKAMKEKGLSKSQFAIAMKVQPSVITKWLSGTQNFTYDTLFDIQKTLSIEIINCGEPEGLEIVNRSYVIAITNQGKLANCNDFSQEMMYKDLMQIPQGKTKAVLIN